MHKGGFAGITLPRIIVFESGWSTVCSEVDRKQARKTSGGNLTYTLSALCHEVRPRPLLYKHGLSR
eukprot:2563557-Alexandrium_andersonii.AAC.1